MEPRRTIFSRQAILLGILALQFSIFRGGSDNQQPLAVVRDVSGGSDIVIKWLGTHTFPYEMDIPNSDPEGLLMETISSISWQDVHQTRVDGSAYIDTDSKVVYATSDNSKLYKLHVDVSDGWLDQGDIVFESAVELLDDNGDASLKANGVCHLDDGGVLVASSGSGYKALSEVSRYSLHGAFESTLFSQKDSPVYESQDPNHFGSKIALTSGFGMLAMTLDKASVITATTKHLTSDELEVTRLMQISAKTGAMQRMLFYPLDVRKMNRGRDSFSLVSIACLDNKGLFGGNLLTLESFYTYASGFNVSIYLVKTANTDDVSSCESTFDPQCLHSRAVKKHLLIDLSDPNTKKHIPAQFPTNLEYDGITLGPRMAGSIQTVLMASRAEIPPDLRTTFVLLGMDLRGVIGALADTDGDASNTVDNNTDRLDFSTARVHAVLALFLPFAMMIGCELVKSFRKKTQKRKLGRNRYAVVET